MTNRWLYMSNALQWILQNHFCLAEYFDDNESPSVAHEWWINAAVVYGVTTIVNVTMVKIQAKNIVLPQQMAEIDPLVDRLRNKLSVVPVPPVAFSPGEADIVSKKYWLPEHCLIDFIKDQGTFVTTHLESILHSEKQSTIRNLGEFILHLIEGLENVQAEWNSRNEAAASISPPVMPSELALIAPREFAESILKPRRLQRSRFWNEAQVEAVEREHRELCSAKLLNTLVNAALDEETYDTSFNDGWDAVEKAAAPSKFSQLRQFCCGLATVFENTASVESDFSILKWEMNDRRTALTSLALEGIFQVNQFKQLENSCQNNYNPAMGRIKGLRCAELNLIRHIMAIASFNEV